MTVKELIAALEKMPLNMPVVYFDGNYWHWVGTPEIMRVGDNRDEYYIDELTAALIAQGYTAEDTCPECKRVVAI